MIEIKILIEAPYEVEKVLPKYLSDGWEILSINTVVNTYSNHPHQPIDYIATSYETIIYLKRCIHHKITEHTTKLKEK